MSDDANVHHRDEHGLFKNRVLDLNRRQVILAGLGSIFLPYAMPAIACQAPSSGLSSKLGLNLIAWDEATNSDPKIWVRAVKSVYALGIRRVTLVPYTFVDFDEARLTARSKHGLVAGPSHSVIRAAMRAARDLKMEVSLKPLIEVDNGEGEGAVWRGKLRFEGEKLTSFMQSYESFIIEMAALARKDGANRFYVGSELNDLTAGTAAVSYWLRLIDMCRAKLSGSNCIVTYAANYDEYRQIPFWSELDEIGIDAYFALATPEEAQGVGAPKRDVIARNWHVLLKELHAFSEKYGRPIFFSEWGVVPFDQTTIKPSDEQPSKTYDPIEALNAYDATLMTVLYAGNWLRGVDFWHWSISKAEDSNYRITLDGEIANLLRAYCSRSH